MSGPTLDNTYGQYHCNDKTSDYSSYFGTATTTYSIQSVSYPTNTVNSPSTTPVSVTYQPEDRYALISDITGTTDENNFIYIVNNTGITDPYIVFYDSSNNVIGGQANGIALNYTEINDAAHTQPGDGTQASPYMIRLPKNATSFQLGNGTALIGSSRIPLYENITVNDNGNNVTLTNYHHAGTTFTINSAGAVTDKTYRDSTLYKSAIEYPREFKTDADHIFFTDVNGTLASGGTVYAYYFGSKDGAYYNDGTTYTDSSNMSWSGVPAQYTYTDNSGNKVYAFPYPTSGCGEYPYVVFNSGANMTEAIAYTASRNYAVETSGGTALRESYGSKSAYKLTDMTAETSPNKNAPATVHYSTTATNGQYLFFVDNGTYDFGVLGNSRYTLDDLHVTFYQDEAGTLAIGNSYPGYRMDKLTQAYDGKTVYRITIPNGANYFQINNGQQKTAGTANNNYRQSEIKRIAANGMYKFVDNSTVIGYDENDAPIYPSEPSDYWNGTETQADITKAGKPILDDHLYYLDLINKFEEEDGDIPETDTYDVKLATIVTSGEAGQEGQQDYIKWLKPADDDPDPEHPTTVDTNYLDHTTADVNNPYDENGPKIQTVKVIKKGVYYWKESVAPAGYEMNEEKQYFTVDNTSISPVTTEIEDQPISGEVVLTKTTKEKVGTTDIGSPLPGAKFKLMKLKADGTEDTSVTLRFTINTTVTETNEYSLGANTARYNNAPNWLETGDDGKLTIKGLMPGDYCLEEQSAPDGYSHLDSNNLDEHGQPKNKRVYFSTGSNTVKKEISCADEMEPAYIKLYEHISEKRDEWGDPTFVFKIKQTGYYDYSGQTPTVTSTEGKEILVALTVNDDGTITDSTSKVLKWVDHSAVAPNDPNQFFTADPIDNALYGNWLVEATSEDEYIGLFRIDEQGRIKVEPGSYEVTRLPVSRYEFVTSGHIIYTTDPTTDPYEDSNNSFVHDNAEKVIITALAGGQTADVHYYDKVAYYDKFTQVDEEINSFHRCTDTNDNNTVKKSVKGIRIEDYHVDTDANTDKHDTVDNDILTVRVAEPDRFKAYFICADGSERQLTSSELAKLNITYVYDDESGDNPSFGHADTDNGETNDFVYYPDTDYIWLNHYDTYKNGVYTLTATYVEDNINKYSTNFDIVFERPTT